MTPRPPPSPSRRRLLGRTLALGAGLGLPCAWAAEAFPRRTVRIIVGHPPGGQTGAMAQVVAQRLAERWKGNVVVEYHAGAAGAIAGRMVAEAAPDGHLLLLSSNAVIVTTPLQTKTSGYDPERDWAPVGRIARTAFVLAVRAGLRATTLREFVDLARTRAEAVTLATVGAGSNSARLLALLERAAGVRILDVPYRGAALGLPAVVAGDVDAIFCDVTLALPFVAAKSLRLLASSGHRRVALAADVPTFAESGFPGVVVEPWYGVVAPRDTPAPVVAELSAALHAALADADLRQRFTAWGYEVISETPPEFAAAIRSEVGETRAFLESGGFRS